MRKSGSYCHSHDLMWHQERGLLPKASFMKGLDAKGVSPEAPYPLRWFQCLKGELCEMIGLGCIAFQVTFTVLATLAEYGWKKTDEKWPWHPRCVFGQVIQSLVLKMVHQAGLFGDWSCRLEVHAIRCFLYKLTHSGLFFEVALRVYTCLQYHFSFRSLNFPS